MAYIGNKPGSKYATLTRQTFSTPTGTSHTLSNTVTNSDDLLLYINNVKQNPADYTASGTTLTTASLAGGTEMYCLYYGKTTETVAVPASSVGDSHMVDMASSKLTGALPAISGASLTSLNATNLGSGTVPDARLGGDKVCKAWVNFNGTGTVAIRDSFNVSSITDVDVGQYQVNISSALANANYSILLGGSGDGIQSTRESSMGISTSGGAISTTSFRIFSTLVDGSNYSDFEFANALVFGD